MKTTLKRRVIVGTTAAIAMTAVLIIGEGSRMSQSWAQEQPNSFPEIMVPKLEDSPKELIDEVWGIVSRGYIDPTFNKQNWSAVRQRYLNRSYASEEEAYKAIQEMLKPLGDPLTRFMDPKET